jgi:signal transduction histidine kinase
VTAGVGLTSMHDRLAAVGGELAISPNPGRGTRVRDTIPLNEAA